MDNALHYISRHKDHILVWFLVWVMFTLMFVESSFGEDFYVDRDLVYFWDFNNELKYCGYNIPHPLKSLLIITLS